MSGREKGGLAVGAVLQRAARVTVEGGDRGCVRIGTLAFRQIVIRCQGSPFYPVLLVEEEFENGRISQLSRETRTGILCTSDYKIQYYR
jgi:hypothetical protein